jgi:hypothetical protein
MKNRTAERTRIWTLLAGTEFLPDACSRSGAEQIAGDESRPPQQIRERSAELALAAPPDSGGTAGRELPGRREPTSKVNFYNILRGVGQTIGGVGDRAQEPAGVQGREPPDSAKTAGA